MKPDEKPDRAILWKKARKPKTENDMEKDMEKDMENIEDNDMVETEDDEDGETLSSVFAKIVSINIYNFQCQNLPYL